MSHGVHAVQHEVEHQIKHDDEHGGGGHGHSGTDTATLNKRVALFSAITAINSATRLFSVAVSVPLWPCPPPPCSSSCLIWCSTSCCTACTPWLMLHPRRWTFSPGDALYHAR